MEIPTIKRLCDAERFCAALKLISEECHLKEVTYNAFGIITFEFKDGSSVGGMRAWKDAGIIPEKDEKKS